MSLYRKTAGLFILSILTTAAMNAQTQTKPIPQHIVYWQMFKHVNFLEQQAIALDQKGNSGSSLRDFYQSHARLTAAETALLKQTAANTAVAVQGVDQQAHDIIVKFRAQVAAAASTKGKVPLPPELTTLQQKRNQLVLDQINALQSGLGATRFQSFDNYVQKSFTPHIVVTTVPATHGSPPAH